MSGTPFENRLQRTNAELRQRIALLESELRQKTHLEETQREASDQETAGLATTETVWQSREAYLDSILRAAPSGGYANL